MGLVRWIQGGPTAAQKERLSGENHASLSDVQNRPLKDFLLYSLGLASATTVTGVQGPVFNIKSATYGAAGDGSTDDTVAIAAASADAVAAGGGVLYYPPGTYIVNPVTAVPSDSGRYYGVGLASNIEHIGCRGASVLKLKSGVLAAGHDPEMFFASGALTNVRFTSLLFDGNGANNQYATHSNSAAFWLRGNSLAVTGMHWVDCGFVNFPGGTVVYLANESTTGTLASDDIVFDRCRFENMCVNHATTDHSTLNLWARGVRVTNTHFTNASTNTYANDLAVALEVHGPGGVFADNHITRYNGGVILSENYQENWAGFSASGNTMDEMTYYGYKTAVGAGGSSKTIDDINIGPDVIRLNDRAPAGGVAYKQGLQLAHQQPIRSIRFAATVTRSAAVTAVVASGVAGVQPATPTASSYTSFLDVSRCRFDGMTFGAYLDASGTQGTWVKRLRFANNECLDLTDPSVGNYAAGLYLDGHASRPVSRVTVRGNDFTNAAPTADYKYGVVLRNTITRVQLDQASCEFEGMTVSDVEISTLVATSRLPALTGSKTWDAGSIADGAQTSTTVTVTGAVMGDFVDAVSLDVAVPAGALLQGQITTANTVTVTLFNKTGGALDLASGTLRARVVKA